ncbi:TPA: hypothetical protein DCW61_02115 [Candidatus Uhrbacteria bacterium]|nr:hypothetical protein [Candidatus Uhrbacteria bacterium]
MLGGTDRHIVDPNEVLAEVELRSFFLDRLFLFPFSNVDRLDELDDERLDEGWSGQVFDDLPLLLQLGASQFERRAKFFVFLL